MESLLKFENYKVLEVQYRTSLKNPIYDQAELNPVFNVGIGINNENNKQSIVKLSVEIGNKDNDDEEYLFVEIVGFFKYDSEEEIDEEELYTVYRINGTAILFPYLRSMVCDVTGKGDQPAILIPPINIYSLFEDSEELI